MSDAGRQDASGIRLSQHQKLAWLRLIRSDNVGPITFRDLINHCGTAQNAIEMLPDLSMRGGATRRIRVAGRDEAERELERAERFGARFVGIGEPEYPRALRTIDGAPPLLAVKGDTGFTAPPCVAVVGARNASISGCKLASRLAMGLGAAGYVVISGLARGIDAAAHKAAMATGTIAAMAGGLDRPYPPENMDLYDEITAGGGLAVSEMPFGWEPRARDFPRRNRLIAGAALGLVVVEAARRSGSLITARRAADFGRLVFAVPGSPLDPRAGGTNELLKEGAIVTTQLDDVVDALAPIAGSAPVPPHVAVDEPDADPLGMAVPPDASERTSIVEALGTTPVEVDDVIRHTGLAAAAVHLILLELDLAGRLHRHPGGLVSIAMT